MKRKVIGLVAMLVLLAIGACAGFAAQRITAAQAVPGVLRLHIRAASDDPNDQRSKLLVRDALLETFGADLAACTSQSQVQATVKLMQDDMQAVAQNVLAQDGQPQVVTISQTCEMFPTRSYNGVTYPAGMYHAVRVDIGAASGQNWWCVLYPPLCTAGYDLTGTPPATQSDSTQVVEGQPADLQVRWLTGEVWARLFG